MVATVANVRIAYNVGIPLSIRSKSEGRGTIVHRDCIRLTALNHERTRRLPSANQHIEQGVVVRELTSVSEGKLINHASLEGVADIEVRITVVSSWIECILVVLCTGAAAPTRRINRAEEV